MVVKRALAAVAGLGLAVAVANAEAHSVTYDFTVTATDGPLIGTTATGTFTYDTSIVPPGGGSVGGTNLLTTLNFTWDGITYNQTTANTGDLGFNANGSLFNADFGTNCIPGGCGTTGGLEQWEVAATVLPASGGFSYAIAGVPSLFGGTGILTRQHRCVPTARCRGADAPAFSSLSISVPEPSALSLLTVSMAGLALAGIRRPRRRT
jgi:hypothetical protein